MKTAPPPVLRLLGSLKLTVVCLILLLLLTIWGTLYQADNGLYLAQERFYRSWVVLVGGVVPFPGAQSVMTLLFVNLVAAVAVLAIRGRLRWSMLVTHTGLIMMLGAGAVTFYFGRESQLTLEEGAASNTAISFTRWELAFFDPDEARGHSRRVHAIDFRALRPGRVIQLPDSNMSIRIEKSFRHAQATKPVPEVTRTSPSGFTDLKRFPRNREPGRDLPGLIFTLFRPEEDSSRYLLWAGDPDTILLSGEDTVYHATLRRQRLPLPALITLVDFKREFHPGSNIAKSYSSKVTVKTVDHSERSVEISMNKPLRIQGYTFYQSSFSEIPGGRETSTFSVVLNYGRTMPYIATGLTAFGMLFHFTGLLMIRIRRQKREQETGI